MEIKSNTNIQFKKISEKRIAEIENISDLYDDFPAEYAYCKPIHISDMANCSDDEYYVIKRISTRYDSEMGLEEWGCYFIFGRQHFYFFYKWDLNEDYYIKLGAHSAIEILPNDFIDASENKKILLEVIRNYLVQEYGLDKEIQDELSLTKGIVVYKGEKL